MKSMKMQHTVIVIIFIGFSLSSVSCQCPIQECNCYKTTEGSLRTYKIDCGDSGFTALPKITPTNEQISELTFRNRYGDPSDTNCVKCNRITQIPANAFHGLKVTKLDLGNNALSMIHAQGFNGLQSDLQEIILEGDKKLSIPWDALSLLGNISRLHVKNFNQRFLDATNKFSNLSNLKTLELIHLNLLYIRKDSFKNRLQKLKTLEIQGNKDLYILPVGALKNLPSLEVLKYNENGLATLPKGAFRKLVNLKELDLSDNKLRMLDKGCFKTVKKNLQYLKLYHNNLKESSLLPMVQVSWKNLQELDLSDNLLASVTGLLRKMKTLTKLKLTNNAVANVTKKDFQQLQNLQSLDLSLNPINTIQSGSFRNCKKLSELILEDSNNGNQRMNLEKNALRGTEDSLTVLNLKQTLIDEKQAWITIKKLKNLEILNLAETGLSRIPNSVFNSLQKLKYLDLKRNMIQKLTFLNVEGLENSLQRIDLDNNKIRTISKCVFQNFTKLQYFNLKDNPLHCDCQLTWLHDWTTNNRNIGIFMELLINPVCQTPSNLSGKYLTNIQRNSLICPSGKKLQDCQNNQNLDVERAVPPPSFNGYFQKLMG